MRQKLTNTYVANYTPRTQRDEIHDTEIPQMFLRASSGKKLYYVRLKTPNGKMTNRKIGDANILTVAQGRELARRYLTNIQLNGDPKTQKSEPTLQDILNDYTEAGQSVYTINMVKTSFENYLPEPLSKLTLLEIEKWRESEKQWKKNKLSTINHKVCALKTLLNWARRMKLINENPIADIKKEPEIDSEPKIRYLTTDERERLYGALDKREADLRAKRTRTRQHTKGKRLTNLSELPFADFFKPLIICALNTGIRRHALLSLKWSDVDFAHETIFLRASSAKSRKNSVLPMNSIVVETLKKWRTQSEGELIFPSPQTGGIMDNCNSSWEALLKSANIQNFRWHDMRHDFASRLVMTGVDLNTVRELMTHSDITMTLRYAHLAPNKKKEAVDKLS